MICNAYDLPTVCARVHHDYGALRAQMAWCAATSTSGMRLHYHMSKGGHALCCIAGIANESHSGTAKPRRWGKSRPFMGQVVAVEGLCQLASSDDKDTIRVEVDLGESGLQYTPGDALGVYPLNCTQVGYHLWPSKQSIQLLSPPKLLHLCGTRQRHFLCWLCQEVCSRPGVNIARSSLYCFKSLLLPTA